MDRCCMKVIHYELLSDLQTREYGTRYILNSVVCAGLKGKYQEDIIGKISVQVSSRGKSRSFIGSRYQHCFT